MTRRAWSVLGAGLLAATVFVGARALPGGVGLAVGSVVHLSACGTFLALVVRSAVLVRPVCRRTSTAWWLISAAVTCWLVGDVVHLAGLVTRGPSPTSPGVPLYLLAYPLLAVALLLLAHRSAGGRRRGAVLEGAIVSLALTVLGLVVVLHPLVDAGALADQRLVGAVYLAADIGLVAVAVHGLAATDRRTPVAWLLTAAVSTTLVCDAGATLLDTSSPVGGLFATGVLLSDALLAAAAVVTVTSLRTGAPTASAASAASTARPQTDDGVSWRRLAAFTAAGAVPALVLAAADLAGASGLALGLGPDHGAAEEHHHAWLAALVGLLGVVMSLLVVLRLATALSASRALARDRERMRRALEHRATHDALTGAADRAHLHDLLAAALDGTSDGTGDGTGDEHDDGGVGVLCVDLDGFKGVNDAHGHHAGDDVLREVVVRLAHAVRPGDVVGRLGGDEFAVVVHGVRDERELSAVADRVLDGLSAPVSAGGRPLDVGASIGAALALPGAGARGAEPLLHEADTALYRAKSRGRGVAVVFDAALRAEVAERTRVEVELRAALERDELELHLQPVVELTTDRVAGFEALVRWQHPTRGLVGPAHFVPVAEQSDLVCDLGRWVLRAAAAQQAAWARLDPRGEGPVVSVNLAPRHLAQARVVSDVTGALASAGCAPGRLVVEITETGLLDSTTAVEHLRQLRAHGVATAIDDFGTGYTSVSQLRSLPCDVLKIDRSLVVGDRPGDRELLQLVVGAARALGTVVLAEGVETAEHEAVVRAVGADLAQGWRWCRAEPAAAFEALVATDGQPLSALPPLQPLQPLPAPRAPEGAVAAPVAASGG